jgi:hypothetical protein
MSESTHKENCITQYKTGGLERTDDDVVRDSVKIDGIEYVVSDRFKASLRDTIIDWTEFKKFYEKNKDTKQLFEHVLKLMNVPDMKKTQKELSHTSLLKKETLAIVKKIYELPLENHLVCLSSQYFLHEPLSHAIQFVFIAIKRHFEEIVELFADCRANFLEEQKLGDVQDFDQLLQHWTDTDTHQNFNTSSVILFFLNPPPNIVNQELDIKIKGLSKNNPVVNALDRLDKAIKQFKYPGFCPKVPKERLDKLLKFPLEEFANAIIALGCNKKLPDYKDVEQKIENIIVENKIEKPVFKEANYKRANPPKISDDIQLINWYMDAILEIRKKLVPHAKKKEDYYTNQAKLFNKIGQYISRILVIE